MQLETKEIPCAKFKRHATWGIPLAVSQIAGYTVTIVNCVQNSQLKDSFNAAKDALIGTINKAGLFLGHYVRDPKCLDKIHDPACNSPYTTPLVWQSSSKCLEDSPGWVACKKAVTEVCQNAFAACSELPGIIAKSDSAWWNAAYWGLGCIGVLAVGAGIVVYLHEKKSYEISSWYDSLKKPFSQLSRDTQNRLAV